MLLRPAIPGWGLLVKPQGTDESGSTWLSSRCLPISSGAGDPFAGKTSERRVQLDTEPVPPVLLSYQSHRAGAEERIEHQSRLPALAAAARLPQLAARRQLPTAKGWLALPGRSARGADPLRAGGQ